MTAKFLFHFLTGFADCHRKAKFSKSLYASIGSFLALMYKTFKHVSFSFQTPAPKHALRFTKLTLQHTGKYSARTYTPVSYLD